MDADIKNTHTSMKVKSEEYHKLFGHHWIKTNGVTWCTMCGEEKEEVQPRALDGPLYNLPKGETK